MFCLYFTLDYRVLCPDVGWHSNEFVGPQLVVVVVVIFRKVNTLFLIFIDTELTRLRLVLSFWVLLLKLLLVSVSTVWVLTRYVHAEYVGDHAVDVDATDYPGEKKLLQLVRRTGVDIETGEEDLAQSATAGCVLVILVVTPEWGEDTLGDGICHLPEQLAGLI